MRTWIRAYLGTHHLEEHMATITDALNRLASQVNAVSAAQATSFTNLQNAIVELRAGNLSPEQQALVDQIEASLVKLGDDAQAGDDGFEPQPPTDEQPGDEDPTVPVDGEPTDGDVLPQDTARRGR